MREYERTRLWRGRGRVIALICLAVAVVAAAWLWRAHRSLFMDVTVRLAGETGAPVVKHVRQQMSATARPVVTVDIDLSQWSGKLARLDLTGALTAGLRRGPAGTVGYAATVRSGECERLVEFVGWKNEGAERFHFGQVGPVSLKGPSREGHTFVYGPEGALWQVLSVQPGDTLRLYFTPLPQADLGSKREAYLPLQAKSWPGTRSTASRPAPAPDVFIYLIDALRADRLGCYGYGRPTSPAIDRFAAQSVVYDQAQTAATCTGPSVATIMTGLFPSAHGLVHMVSETPDKLDTWPVTLPEALRAAGYRTMWISTNGHASAHYGFQQGVERYAYVNKQPASWVMSQAEQFLRGEDPSRRVFAYMHTVETHFPYTPNPNTWRLLGLPGMPKTPKATLPGTAQPTEDAAGQRDAYDCEVRDADTAFGDFIAFLQRTGRFDNALIIVLADHGEALGERGAFGHGDSLHIELTHVPLLLHYPKGRYAGTHVTVPVSLVDLYPTILAVTGAAPRLGYELPGRDLAPLAASPAHATRVPLFFEVADGMKRWDLVGVLDEAGYKRVWDLSPQPGKGTAPGTIGVWDTRTDPKEVTDLTPSQPLRTGYDEMLMAHYLVAQRWWRGASTPGAAVTAPLTPEMRKALINFGYLK